MNFEYLPGSKKNSNIFGVYLNWQRREIEVFSSPRAVFPNGYNTNTKNADLYFVKGKELLRKSNMRLIVGPKLSMFYTRVKYIPKQALEYPEIHNRFGIRVGPYLGAYKKLTNELSVNLSVFGDLIETYALYHLLQNPTLAPRLHGSSSIEVTILPKRIYFSFGIGFLMG